MDVSLTAWVLTILGVLAIFAFDFLVIGRRPHVVSMREATFSVLAYVGLAALFGIGIWVVSGQQYGAEFFAGYVTELSLSVDNLFVFVVLMSAFAVPQEHQLKVLQLGIVGALVLRMFFLLDGLLDRLIYLSLGLAVILGFIGAKLILHAAHEYGAHTPDISTATSLLVIVVTLLLTVIASLAKVRKNPEVLQTHDVTGHHHPEGAGLEELRAYGNHPGDGPARDAAAGTKRR